MKFLRVVNEKTQRTFYYIDGKRVSENKYWAIYDYCTNKGMHYNCSSVTTSESHTRYISHFN